jgi:hypothetical protein
VFCHSRTHQKTCAVAIAVLLGGLAAAASPLAAQPSDDAAAGFEERFSFGERSEPLFARPETQRVLSSLPPEAADDGSVASAEASEPDAYSLAQLPFPELTGPARILEDVISAPAALAEAEQDLPPPAQDVGMAPAQVAGAPAEAQPSEDVASMPDPGSVQPPAEPSRQAQLPEPELPPPPIPAEVVLPPEQPEAPTATASTIAKGSSETPAKTSSVSLPPPRPQAGPPKAPPTRARVSKKSGPEWGKQTAARAKQRRNAAQTPASTDAKLMRALKRDLADVRQQMNAIACRIGTGCVSPKQLVGTAAGAVAGGAAAGPGGAVAGGAAGAIMTAPRTPLTTGTGSSR